MVIQPITSRDNPRFKALKRLAESGRERRKTGLTLLDGMHLIEAWVASGRAVEGWYLSDAIDGTADAARIRALAGSQAVTVLHASLFREMSPVDTPTGTLACVQVPQVAGRVQADLDTVVLDGIQDPGNVGTILRTAAAAGFRQAVLSEECAGAWSPRCLRAGMGGQFVLQVFEQADIAGFLERYRGLSLAAALGGQQAVYDVDMRGPVVWVFGSEGQGIRPEVLARTQCHVEIPMVAAIESLNVAAAAAICLYEAVRQRRRG